MSSDMPASLVNGATVFLWLLGDLLDPLWETPGVRRVWCKECSVVWVVVWVMGGWVWRVASGRLK
jgi:hypothetical protein